MPTINLRLWDVVVDEMQLFFYSLGIEKISFQTSICFLLLYYYPTLICGSDI